MNEMIGYLGLFHDLLWVAPDRIEVAWKPTPDVSGWRLWAADSLQTSYNALATSGLSGSPTFMFRVMKQEMFQSPTIAKKNIFVPDVSGFKGGKAVFDLSDYTTPGNTVPNKEQIAFLRTQVIKADGTALTVAGAINSGLPVLGPSYLIPPPSFFGMSEPSVNISSSAPGNTTCAAYALPVFDLSMQAPLPLHIVFPRLVREAFITNLSSDKTLLYSTDPGMPMRAIPFGATAECKGNFKQLIFAAGGADACPFAVEANAVSWSI